MFVVVSDGSWIGAIDSLFLAIFYSLHNPCLFLQVMENYGGISVMSASDHCDIQNVTLASADTAVSGHLASTVDLHDSASNRVIVVADKSQIDVLQA